MAQVSAVTDDAQTAQAQAAPFAAFAPRLAPASARRAAITAATLRSETDCMRMLLDAARPADDARARDVARRLTERLRTRGKGGVEALLHEFALSSEEGVALMCLAEALLRIPDMDTRDALIRDKIAGGDWLAHLGWDRPLFVNAAAWGLLITGRLSATVEEGALTPALGRMIARCGEPVVRAGVSLAMRLMGEQFVAGQDIATALRRAAPLERRGYRHSYDMLGEAAMTDAEALRYLQRYEEAIDAVGAAARGAGVIRGPGVSVKLSALHPRYSRAQAQRVMAELTPRLKQLALRARRHDIGLTVDAEEADRLELSLDIFEALRLDPDLAGWSGLGLAIQAYGRRCPEVIDWLVDLARRSGARIMVRLVKGAYWDTEIKRAQTAGLADFPVFTRKAYTDVSWLACARRLLEAGELLYPQFATHNARSVADILAMTEGKPADQWEFQCLHGMGEALYDQLTEKGVPCRIYAPVGPHDTLLAYLVRRLLENGANTSFVHLAAQTDAKLDDLIASPVFRVEAMASPGAPHPAIRPPPGLFAPRRRNSAGMDLSNEAELAALWSELRASARQEWRSAPVLACDEAATESERAIVNPGDHRDVIGHARDLAPVSAGAVMAAAGPWREAADARAACLERAADLLERNRGQLMGLIMREAGKCAANALGEVREAVDFLRHYAAQLREEAAEAGAPLGTVLCISPWNFPLAIFVGQIAVALAAGNGVVAKPAEETPLIAAATTRLLHEAGVPRHALQLAPGDGALGAALVACPDVSGVMFTGSTEAARSINRQLARRVTEDGETPLLIAETGGLNCMVVDSSALTEQVVADAVTSAFDSAGQRCSALRVLCLQEEIADTALAMLKGAVAELTVGRTDALHVDVGPVISADAEARLEAHVARLAARGRRITRPPLPEVARHGTFVAPTIIEIADLADVPEEAFGPVLHVLRWPRNDLDGLIDAINGAGYGLTFGLHTRIDETVRRVTTRIRAGNIYVNRNMIGAVVGSQPFGGRGLSGTGPKAGGHDILRRLWRRRPDSPLADAPPDAELPQPLRVLAGRLAAVGRSELASAVAQLGRRGAAALGHGSVRLPGPVGESNLLERRACETLLLAPFTESGLYGMIPAALACAKRAVILACAELPRRDLPHDIAARIAWIDDLAQAPEASAALLEGDAQRLALLRQSLAAHPGAIIPTICATPEQVTRRNALWPVELLPDETAISINIAASGGDPGLLMLDAET